MSPNQRSNHADVKYSISRGQGGGWTEQVPQPRRLFSELVPNDCGIQANSLSVPGPSHLRPRPASRGVFSQTEPPWGPVWTRAVGLVPQCRCDSHLSRCCREPHLASLQHHWLLLTPSCGFGGQKQRSRGTGQMWLSPVCTGNSSSHEALVTWGRPEAGRHEWGHNRIGTQATVAVSSALPWTVCP